MRKQTGKFIAACVGLSAFGFAVAGDLQVTSLGNCISQLEEKGDLAIEICEAQRVRAAIKPGTSGCAALSRVDNGKIRCSKSDTASVRTGTGAVFKKYYARLGAPLTIGNINTFYGNRHAGAGNRFAVTQRSDGKLQIRDSQGLGNGAESCTLISNSLRCEIDKGFSGWSGRQTRNSYVYSMRLDGLLVEHHQQRRKCAQYYCSPGGCSSRCARYSTSPIVKTVSQIYPWN